MDSKYEFNLKMDQLKKLISQEDYQTAYKIVDSIDWNRVRNVNLLTMAASVYERNDRPEEAKEILVSALDRAPVGKRILYKLSELSVITGDLDDAEDYYYEFRRADPTDIGNYLLQYMILNARHAPYDKQASALELYCDADPDERWLYELAATYDRAGEADKCVETADKIALLYGGSEYSAKALRLKMKYASLTGEQQNILYPRSYMDKAYVNADPAAKNAEDTEESDLYRVYGLMDSPDISTVEALKSPPAEEYVSGDDDFSEARRRSDALAAERYEDEDSVFDEYVRQMDLSARYEHRQEVARKLTESPQSAAAPEEAPVEAQDAQGEGEAQLSFVFDGGETPRVVMDAPEDEPSSGADAVDAGEAVVSAAIEATSPAATAGAAATAAVTGATAAAAATAGAAAAATVAAETEAAAPTLTETPAPAPAAKSAPAAKPGGFHMIVEAADQKKAFDIAIDELKAIHSENGINNPAAKTSAAKLNSTGFNDAIRDRILGKDLIIEHAGSLREDVLRALFDFINTDESGAIVVLLDTPEGLDSLEAAEPGLFDICDYVSDEGDELVTESDAYEDDYDEDIDDDAEPSRVNNLREVQPAGSDEQMEIDDFAQFCTQYAASIDCSITGKSMLALYERIELMEEDGIPLTRETAVDLIEEAADRAEKPPIGKRISGAFHSKYDKNGLLILKEDDFI